MSCARSRSDSTSSLSLTLASGSHISRLRLASRLDSSLSSNGRLSRLSSLLGRSLRSRGHSSRRLALDGFGGSIDAALLGGGRDLFAVPLPDVLFESAVETGAELSLPLVCGAVAVFGRVLDSEAYTC